MNDNNTKLDEIQGEDKKAFPKFILIMVVCGLIGMVLGFLSAILISIQNYSMWDFETFSKAATDLWVSIGQYLIIAANVIVLPVLWILLAKHRKELKAWDGEDEEVYERIDKKLSIGMSVSGTMMIFDMLTYGIGFYGAFSEGTPLTVLLLIDLVMFLGSTFCIVFYQKALVNLLKEYNPEKQGSVFDMKFNKKWLASCDEAEKQRVGEASYATYAFMNIVYEFVSLVLMVAGFTFPIGVLPLTIVCLLWMTQMICYSIKARMLTKGI